MSVIDFFRNRFAKTKPTYDAAGQGRRSLAWWVGNPGPADAVVESLDQLRAKSRDQVRRNAWAAAGVDAFVANAVGTGIKPQSQIADADVRTAIQSLWRRWSFEADSAELTDFYGLQALACRAMVEGGECFIRLRRRRLEDDLPVPLQLQLLESEHLPTTLNTTAKNGNSIRAGIEFDRMGKRVAYHMTRVHPNDATTQTGADRVSTVRIPANQVMHLFRPLRPGQLRGEPWLARALVKLEELDQYDDAELVRKKTAALFAGFITRQRPEDNLMGEGKADASGIALTSLEPGTLQLLEPGEEVTFSDPADVGNAYADFMRQQFRAVAAAMGITYEMLTGDLTQVNYSSIRAGLLEFRRRCEAIQYGVIVHQLCRPVWNAWMDQAVLSGALELTDYTNNPRRWRTVKWIPQGWQWVDPQKEFNAMLTAIRSGLLSRSQAVSAFGYDAEDIDREIAADNARADELGLVFDSDPRHSSTPSHATTQASNESTTPSRHPAV